MKEDLSEHFFDESIENKQLVRNRLFWSITVIIVLVLIWAFSTETKVSSSSLGVVVNNTPNLLIQAPFSGSVKEIYVREGQTAHKGQVLLSIDPITLLKEQQALTVTLLKALIDYHYLNSGSLEYETSLNKATSDPRLDTATSLKLEALLRQPAIYSLVKDSILEAHPLYNIQREIDRTQSALISVIESLKITALEISLLEGGADLDAVKALKGVQLKQEMLKKQLVEAAAKLRTQYALHEELRTRTLSEKNRQSQTLIKTLLEKNAQLHATLQSSEIKSPETGIVTNIHATLNQAVNRKDMLLSITKRELHLAVETKIEANKRAFITIGDPVVITLDSRQQHLGKITGVISEIAKYPINNDQYGMKYYKAKIYLDKTYSGSIAGEHTLKAGMVVQTTIQTQEQNVLKHWLTPILEKYF